MTAAETSTSSARRQDFFILLHFSLFILYTAETFLKVVFFVCLFFAIWGGNKAWLLSSQISFSCFCCSFCALSWTFMSLPVSRGVCSQFVPDLVQLVSLLYIYIYTHSVSLVLRELLNVMVVCLPVVFGLLFVLVCFPRFSTTLQLLTGMSLSLVHLWAYI